MDQRGELVHASGYTREDWEALKAAHKVGAFKMECCSAVAIPKTSSNFLQFFAHISSECGTSPESLWHRQAKRLVVDALAQIGLTCREEELGPEWRADTFLEIGQRSIAIEIQHSYQHLRDYQARQKRYLDAGIESYWLVYPSRFKALCLSMGKHRLLTEFGNKLPLKGSFYPCLGDLPVAELRPEPVAMVHGVGCFEALLPAWLTAVLEKRFVWRDGVWGIDLA